MATNLNAALSFGVCCSLVTSPFCTKTETETWTHRRQSRLDNCLNVGKARFQFNFPGNQHLPSLWALQEQWVTFVGKKTPGEKNTCTTSQAERAAKQQRTVIRQLSEFILVANSGGFCGLCWPNAWTSTAVDEAEATGVLRPTEYILHSPSEVRQPLHNTWCSPRKSWTIPNHNKIQVCDAHVCPFFQICFSDNSQLRKRNHWKVRQKQTAVQHLRERLFLAPPQPTEKQYLNFPRTWWNW